MNTGELIGFLDLGDIDLNDSTIQNVDKLAPCVNGFHHGCFKSHIAALKRFFIFVRRSGTSLASKCKHGSSLDISFLSVTRIL